MAYNKERGDSPMRRRGPRRRKKVCASESFDSSHQTLPSYFIDAIYIRLICIGI